MTDIVGLQMPPLWGNACAGMAPTGDRVRGSHVNHVTRLMGLLTFRTEISLQSLQQLQQARAAIAAIIQPPKNHQKFASTHAPWLKSPSARIDQTSGSARPASTGPADSHHVGTMAACTGNGAVMRRRIWAASVRR
jgi:hypothetical protein